MSARAKLLLLLPLGVAGGVALAYLDRSLPSPLGLIVVLVFLVAVMWWAFKQWRWARAMLRDLRNRDDGP